MAAEAVQRFDPDAGDVEAFDADPGDVAPFEGRPFTAASFDVQFSAAAGRASLSLVDDADEALIAEWTMPPTPVVPPRILVDGSMVETFAGGATAFTTRAYPTQTSRWVLRFDEPASVRAWALHL
jgi:beta-fructofuranosidase